MIGDVRKEEDSTASVVLQSIQQSHTTVLVLTGAALAPAVPLVLEPLRKLSWLPPTRFVGFFVRVGTGTDKEDVALVGTGLGTDDSFSEGTGWCFCCCTSTTTAVGGFCT